MESRDVDKRVSCGEALVCALEAHGVTHVFGIPGTHNLSIYEPLAASSIRHVTPRHEQGAGYAADGYARAGGRPGICLTTTGPGLTNIITAAATAYHDSIPMIVISPGMATDVDGRDTGFLHEVKAQSAALDNIVAWSRRVGSAGEAATAVRDAFASFASGRPRPVHIELPLDVLARPAQACEVPVAAPVEHSVDEDQVASAAEALRRAERPCLLLGGGAIRAGGPAREVAERLGALVFTTANAKGVVSEAHPLSLGASLRLGRARRALAEADVVLAVGTELSESDLWVSRLELSGELVRIDIDERQLHKNARASHPVLADAGTALRRLAEQLGPPAAAPPAAALDRAAVLREELERELLQDAARYAELHAQIGAAAGDDGILVGDSAMPVYYGSVHQFIATRPRRFVYPAGYATLGYALPAAIGAKLARPGSRVLGLMGDGGAMFSIAELASAVELGLPIPLIVVANGGYGEIKAEMLQRGAAPIGVDLHAPDFVALAEAFGARGVRVEDVGTLAGRLREAFAAPVPTLLEIPQDLLS